MKQILITILFFFPFAKAYSQEDTLSMLYKTEKWRHDYSSSLPIKIKDSTYIIPKHSMNKKYNKAVVTYEENSFWYLVFDSCKLFYYGNFIELFDEKKYIAYHKVVDSLVLFGRANFILQVKNNKTLLVLTNFQDVLADNPTEGEFIREIIYISDETLILLDENKYVVVYTNDNIKRGKSKIEKDDYFLVDVLVNYFKSKNILYEIEDDQIISDALEKIHGKN
jgi:hypothetical protein